MMSQIEYIKNLVANVTEDTFNEALSIVLDHQLKNNTIYNNHFHQFINKKTFLPFLPISAFKLNKVVCNYANPDLYFASSGTTGQIPSKHYINDLNWYLNHATSIFTQFYKSPAEYCFLALLPHYLERQNSSLIHMMNHFIGLSNYAESGFYLDELNELFNKLNENKKSSIPTILFGVSFALLDFSEQYKIDYPNLIIMETGGMKGRREEILRSVVHSQLCLAYGTINVHSEYGMTELLSQAYSKGNGRFICPPSMKIIITEIMDPLKEEKNGKAGIINIIDLANFESCPFIATEDIGIKYDDGSFEILGRLDNSELRGCNLLISDL
jgi:hypothetical protein